MPLGRDRCSNPRWRHPRDHLLQRDGRGRIWRRCFSFLDLKDDELDDVIVGEEEVKQFEADARWFASGKLNMSCPFSSSAMFETLQSVWGLAHVSKYREAGDNLFMFHMY